jgi:hypothetical protein
MARRGLFRQPWSSQHLIQFDNLKARLRSSHSRNLHL